MTLEVEYRTFMEGVSGDRAPKEIEKYCRGGLYEYIPEHARAKGQVDDWVPNIQCRS